LSVARFLRWALQRHFASFQRGLDFSKSKQYARG